MKWQTSTVGCYETEDGSLYVESTQYEDTGPYACYYRGRFIGRKDSLEEAKKHCKEFAINETK